MVKTLEQIVIEYERYRADVQRLTNKRRDLANECENIDEDLDGFQIGEICLSSAYKELMGLLEDNFPERYDFQEVLDEGNYCDFCRESYRLKYGALAKAKKDFGNAKRALSRRGKNLIGDITT